MKKLLFIMLLFLGAFGNAHAQDVRWGFIGGLNLSRYDHSWSSNKPGFHAGIKAEVPIAKRFYFDGAAMLSLKGAKLDGNRYKARPYYLEIPLHVGYKYPIARDFKLFAGFGPYFAVGLFGNFKEKWYDHDEFPRHRTIKCFKDDLMNRFDAGLGIRFGIEVRQNLQFSFAYDWGLADVADDWGAWGVQNRNFMMSFGYMF